MLNTIFHLAAVVPIIKVNKDKKYVNKVNFQGTKNIIDAILKTKINWFFFINITRL